MKVLKVSFLLILMESALLLSGASVLKEEAENALQNNSPRSKNEKPSSDSKSAATTKNQKLAEQFPPALDFNKSPVKDKGKESSHEGSNGPSWTDRAIAAFTGILVLVGIGQVIVYAIQARYMRRGLRLTRRAANAAQKSAEAATEGAKAAQAALHAERPFLLVTKVVVTYEIPPSRESGIYIAAIDLRNFGVGPADIINYTVEVELFDRIPEPNGSMPDPVINYNGKEANRINDSLVPPRETVQELFTARISVTAEEIAALRHDTKRIGVHGVVRYRGPYPQEYESRFFWWYFYDRTCHRALSPELNAHT